MLMNGKSPFIDKFKQKNGKKKREENPLPSYLFQKNLVMSESGMI